MSKWAYYNDVDPNACAWLRELMRDGLITEGEIDERSITEVSASDVRGFRRIHLFSGVAGWERALQLAGWPDDKPILTCSCPCPPFSSAGKKKACPVCAGISPMPCPRRTGYFICCDCGHAWFADGRHLWPEAWRIISQCRPANLFGEQVASDDGRAWLAGVRATLEMVGFAVGATDYCSAGVGSPNIRQRLWWSGQRLEQPAGAGWQGRVQEPHEERERFEPRCENGRLADAHGRESGDGGLQRGGGLVQQPENEVAGGVEHAKSGGLGIDGSAPRRAGHADEPGEIGRLGDAHLPRPQGRLLRGDGGGERAIGAAGVGFWDEREWIACSDGKQRAIKSGIFPLSPGLPRGMVPSGDPGVAEADASGEARVMRLRGYGNSINVYAAARFIYACESHVEFR